MSDIVLLFASSREFGNTRLVADLLCEEAKADLLFINQLNLSYYDYEHSNQTDRFIPTFEAIIKYKTLIFVTPVYWYSMCAQMKTFFDRMSDLLTIRKDLGRSLAGKQLGAICCSSDKEIYPGFFMPFERSAQYLDMVYIGHCHTWIENGAIPDDVLKSIKHFASAL
jgi:multimeric flavodoxin WrbA